MLLLLLLCLAAVARCCFVSALCLCPRLLLPSCSPRTPLAPRRGPAPASAAAAAAAAASRVERQEQEPPSVLGQQQTQRHGEPRHREDPRARRRQRQPREHAAAARVRRVPEARVRGVARRREAPQGRDGRRGGGRRAGPKDADARARPLPPGRQQREGTRGSAGGRRRPSGSGAAARGRQRVSSSSSRCRLSPPPPSAISTRQSTAEPSKPAVASLIPLTRGPGHGGEEAAAGSDGKGREVDDERRRRRGRRRRRRRRAWIFFFSHHRRLRGHAPEGQASVPQRRGEDSRGLLGRGGVPGRHFRSRARQPLWASANASAGGGRVGGVVVAAPSLSFARFPTRRPSPLPISQRAAVPRDAPELHQRGTGEALADRRRRRGRGVRADCQEATVAFLLLPLFFFFLFFSFLLGAPVHGPDGTPGEKDAAGVGPGGERRRGSSSGGRPFGFGFGAVAVVAVLTSLTSTSSLLLLPLLLLHALVLGGATPSNKLQLPRWEGLLAREQERRRQGSVARGVKGRVAVFFFFF